MRYWFALLLLIGLVGLTSQGDAQDSTINDYFAEAVISNPSPFIGEQIVYTFRFYTSVPFDTAPSYQPPNFEGFWRTDMELSRSGTAQLNGRVYSTAEQSTALYPTREGELTIEPALLIIPATVFAEAQRTPTNRVQIQVRPLPEGAPEGFDGAVGQFSMEALLDRQTLEQGQPFTLRIIVTGTGNVEQLNTPALSLPEQWRVYTNPSDFQALEENNTLIGIKAFEWLLSPTETGTLSLPSVSLSYFDPADLTYKTVSTGEVTLNVLPSSQAEVQTRLEPDTVNIPALKAIASPLQFANAQPSFFFWVLWIVSPALLAAAWLWKRQHQLVPPERPSQRRRAALQQAQKQLKQVVKASPGDATVLLRTTLTGYLSTFLNKNILEIDQYELQTYMNDAGVDPHLIERIHSCLEWADRIEYAPDSRADVHKLIERIQQVIAALDKTWAKSA